MDKNKKEAQRIVDRFLELCVEIGNIDLALCSAEALCSTECGASEAAINKLVEYCLEKQYLERAFEIAKFGCSEGVRDILIKHYIHNRRLSENTGLLGDAFDVAKLGLSKEVRNLLMGRFIEEGFFGSVFNLGKVLGISGENLSFLLERMISSDAFFKPDENLRLDYVHVLHIGGRRLNSIEIDQTKRIALENIAVD